MKTIPDTRAVKQWIAATGATSAAVVGGGFIGIEMAENLVHLGLDTCIVEMLPQVGGDVAAGGRVVTNGVSRRAFALRLSEVLVKFLCSLLGGGIPRNPRDSQASQLTELDVFLCFFCWP